jgi:hypothetical protein
MEWFDGRPRIKLTGHRSAEEIDTIFSRSLVDVAYVIDATSDAVFIVADDPEWPSNAEDRDWLFSIINETLVSEGITNCQLSFVPNSTDNSNA